LLILKIMILHDPTNTINTSTSGLIQAVRKKTAGSHVVLCGNVSAPVQVTDLVEVSKEVASLLVSTSKKIFLLEVAGLL